MAVDRDFDESSERHIRAARLAKIAAEGRAAFERASAWAAAPAGTPYPAPKASAQVEADASNDDEPDDQSSYQRPEPAFIGQYVSEERQHGEVLPDERSAQPRPHEGVFESLEH